MELTLPVFALSRLRMATDGHGVTTLVCAQGCPLRCRYCLNPQSWLGGGRVRSMTPRQLWDALRRDDLYFRATCGGATFGGGEPLAHADFIAAFREVCGGAWRLTVETSLNVDPAQVRTAMACADEFVVDIKDANPEIYRRYTSADNALMRRNLTELARSVDPSRVLVRVPRIPGYNTPEDVSRSVEWLRSIGINRIDTFAYIVRRNPAMEGTPIPD